MIEFPRGGKVKKITALLIIPALLMAHEVFLSFSEDPIAGRTVDLVLTIFDNSFPFMGKADLHPSAGKFSESPVEFVGGSALVKYTAPKDPVFVKVKAKLDDGFEIKEIEFSFQVLPDYEKMEKTYLELIEFGGHVSYKKKGEDFYRPVSMGTRFHEGDEIWVQEDSYAVIDGPGGTRIEIAPNSKVLVKSVRKDKNTVFLRVEVEKGEVVSRVVKELFNTVLLVDGGSVTAGVRGTILGMEVREGVVVRNYEGEVWVKAGSSIAELRARRMMRFTSEVLSAFDRAQRRVMKKFEEMRKEMMKGFEQKARELLSTFGMEDAFEIDLSEFSRPLDKDLSTFEDMMKKLRKKWRKGGK